MEVSRTAPRQETKYDRSVSVNMQELIGKPGQPVRVLAFSGGLFEAAMQLGTVHALLVSRAEPPEVVAGMSTGAINAVAAAEILQAGRTVNRGAETDAQVARFLAIAK